MILRKSAQAVVTTLIILLSHVAWAQSYEGFLKAIQEGDLKVVAALLDRGLDPNTADPAGNTVLMIAARLGHRELVALLIERKASLARRSPHGDTALMMASLGGHLGIVKLLVEKGAAVNQGGWAPLHYAAFAGHGEVAQFLIGNGADRNARAPNGFSPLMLAARGGHVAAARVLLYEDADVGIRGPNGETALAIARANKNEELVELLRRAGAVD